MSSTALSMHVPVDKLEIVDGPSSRELGHSYVNLLGILPEYNRYETVEFTFKTAASIRSFKRFVKVATINPCDGSGFLEPVEEVMFTGIFFGTYVEGFYNLKTRTGYIG